MNEAERQLAEDRAVRRQARGLFDTRLAQVKADYEARGIGGRIKAKAADRAFDAADQAIDVARQSKGIIAATIGALALWIFRAPLVALFRSATQGRPDSVQDQPDTAPHDDQE